MWLLLLLLLPLGLVHLFSPILPAPQAIASFPPLSPKLPVDEMIQGGKECRHSRERVETDWVLARGPMWGLLGSSSPRRKGVCLQQVGAKLDQRSGLDSGPRSGHGTLRE